MRVCACAHSHTDDSDIPWQLSRVARERGVGCGGGGASEGWWGSWTVNPTWSRSWVRPQAVQGGQTRGCESGGCVSAKLLYLRAKRSVGMSVEGIWPHWGDEVKAAGVPLSPTAVPAPSTAHRGAQASHLEGRRLWVCRGVTRSLAMGQQGDLGQVTEFICASASLSVGWDNNTHFLGCLVILNEVE